MISCVSSVPRFVGLYFECVLVAAAAHQRSPRYYRERCGPEPGLMQPYEQGLSLQRLSPVSHTKPTCIHRHQTRPRYRHTVHDSHSTCQPPPFGVMPTTAKRDVIHKTRNIQHSATLPEEDRYTEYRGSFCADQSSGSKDMLAYRQTDTQTHKHTDRCTDRRVDHNTLHPYQGAVPGNDASQLYMIIHCVSKKTSHL